MTVPDVLHAYIQRGIFQNLTPVPDKGVYDFVWLNNQRMRLHWQSNRRTILFRDVLPNVPARSKLYRELRAHLASRSNPDLPAHRRLDSEAFELVCENRKSLVSIGLRLKSGSEEAGTRKLMSVVHETFLFLHDRWPNYMYESFGSPLE